MFTFISLVLDCITNSIQHFKYGRQPCSNVNENQMLIANDYVSNNIALQCDGLHGRDSDTNSIHFSSVDSIQPTLEVEAATAVDTSMNISSTGKSVRDTV